MTVELLATELAQTSKPSMVKKIAAFKNNSRKHFLKNYFTHSMLSCTQVLSGHYPKNLGKSKSETDE